MTDEHDPYDEQGVSDVPDGLPCVELEFATLRRFREEMAPYLNYDGFFARTDRPLPRGTLVEFRFGMPEDFVLAKGTAVVAWTIVPEGNPDLVPGMALRFGEVGKQSRAVIDELVDFHIATGGDPFDVGPRSGGVGDIPTDSLGGVGGGAPSVIDSPAPTPRDFPLPPDPDQAPPAEEGILPDWLSGQAAETDQPDVTSAESPAPPDRVEPSDSFKFQDTQEERPPTSTSIDGLDLSAESSGEDFQVDMIFDNGAKDTTPIRPENGSFKQMAMTPRADNKPPSDIRLGLIVSAAMVMVAIVVLGVTYWWKNRDIEVVESLPVIEEVSETGVALIEDDADDVFLEEAPVEGGEAVAESATETASRLAAETAARMAADLSADDPVDPDESPFVAEAEVADPEGRGETPTRAIVTEQRPEVISPPVAQTLASRVLDVTAAARTDGTIVVIRGDGAFDASGIRSLRLEDPLRLWFNVSPIQALYKPNEIEVNSAEIRRIRIGYHPEDSPPALYVVLDLAGDDVFLLDTSVQGDAIRLTVGRK